MKDCKPAGWLPLLVLTRIETEKPAPVDKGRAFEVGDWLMTGVVAPVGWSKGPGKVNPNKPIAAQPSNEPKRELWGYPKIGDRVIVQSDAGVYEYGAVCLAHIHHPEFNGGKPSIDALLTGSDSGTNWKRWREPTKADAWMFRPEEPLQPLAAPDEWIPWGKKECPPIPMGAKYQYRYEGQGDTVFPLSNGVSIYETMTLERLGRCNHDWSMVLEYRIATERVRG